MRILSPFPSGYTMILIQAQGASTYAPGNGDLFQQVSYQDPWAQGIDVGFVQVFNDQPVPPGHGPELEPGVWEVPPNAVTETTTNGSTLITLRKVADFPRNKFTTPGQYDN